jgi:hypothetical protein
VKDSAGDIYLLSSDDVFAGIEGTPVLHPSVIDEANLNDVVAKVSRSIPHQEKGNQAAGAIARLEPSIPYESASAALGQFAGVGTVSPGDEVRLVGRTSGVVKGKVVAVNTTVTIGGLSGGMGSTTFSGLCQCIGENGKPFSQPGDSGPPWSTPRTS